MLSRTLLPLVLLSLFLSAAQAQTFGPELRLGAFRTGGGRSDEGLVYVAPRPDGYLAFYSRNGQIRTVRIDLAGHTILDSARIVFEPSRFRPFLRGTGDSVIYFWIDQASIYYSPAAADGTAANPNGILISDYAAFTDTPLCNRTHCLIPYLDIHAAPSVRRAAIVPVSGDGPPQIVTPPALFYRPGGGVDDNGFLLTGIGGSDSAVHAVRIGNDGQQTFDTIVETGESSVITAADFDGEQYALVWINGGFPKSEKGTFIAHLSLDGKLSDTRKLSDLSELSGLIVWTGAEHRFVYSVQTFRYAIPEQIQPADIRIDRLGRDLAPLAPTLQLTPAGEGNYVSTVAVNGRATYVGWNESLRGGFSLVMHGALIDGQGNVAARDILSIGPLAQVPAALASNGEQYLALWTETDYNADRMQLRFARVTRDGTILDGTRFAGNAPAIGLTAAAAIGSDWLVVWNQIDSYSSFAQSLRGAIIHGDGTLTELTLPPLGRNGQLSIATNGESWIVVDGVRAIRVSRSGLVLTPNPVQFGGTAVGWTGIAWDGSHYLVVWQGFAVPSCADCGGIHMAMLNPDLTIAVPDRAIVPEAGEVALAFNGREYLLERTLGPQVILTRITTSGQVAGAPVTLLRPAGEAPFNPIAIRLGDGWLATWQTPAGRLAVRVGRDGDAGGTPVPTAFTQLVSTENGTVVGLTAHPVDDTPAVFLQEMTWQDVTRRRAAR